jgi:hypothetical protein
MRGSDGAVAVRARAARISLHHPPDARPRGNGAKRAGTPSDGRSCRQVLLRTSRAMIGTRWDRTRPASRRRSDLVDRWLASPGPASASRPSRPAQVPGRLARPRHDEDLPAAGAFHRPALVVWTPEDRVQRPKHGRRLAQVLPDARLWRSPTATPSSCGASPRHSPVRSDSSSPQRRMCSGRARLAALSWSEI